MLPSYSQVNVQVSPFNKDLPELFAFKGYAEASFTGEGISDRLLLQVSERVGRNLTKVRLQSSSSVTDVSLHSLVSSAAGLTSLTLEDLSRTVTGE